MSDATATRFAVQPIRAGDWRHVRDLRLEMLADTPLAYLERLETAQARSNEEWQQRAASAATATSCGFAAIETATGRWIGTARAGVFEPGGPATVFSVYLAPAFRGSGAADALLEQVEGWARNGGHDAIYLEVHEDNPRAAAFYRRRGYEFTGGRRPYELEPSQSDLEMRKPLR